jgi:predicted Rossmann fold nucleotide-binding protein DprA/Smf involved in DNA uptake
VMERPVRESAPVPVEAETIPASATACALFAHLGEAPLPPDLLLESSGLSAAEFSGALLELELQGLILAVGGGYQRHSQRLPLHET